MSEPTAVTGGSRAHSPIHEMLGTAVDAFRLLSADSGRSHRMADAGLTCALHVTDLDVGLTALLDRDPIDVEERVRPDAVARIFGTAEAWVPVFLKGNLGIAIARGELEYEGPVREFLRVFPIFRTAYGELSHEPGVRRVTHEGGLGA